MSLTEGIGEALGLWTALPLEALRNAAGPLTILAVAFGFGLLHALLPGHGKALLAAHGAAVRPGGGRVVSPLLDGLTLAGSRGLVAFVLVVGSVQLAGWLGVTLPVRALQIGAGLALVAFALHLAWQAGLQRRAVALGPDPVPAGTAGQPLERSLLVLSLTPEPVTLALTSFGLAGGDLGSAALAALGVALGTGVTLGVTTALASLATVRLADTGRAARVAPYAAFALAAILAMTGLLVMASAR